MKELFNLLGFKKGSDLLYSIVMIAILYTITYLCITYIPMIENEDFQVMTVLFSTVGAGYGLMFLHFESSVPYLYLSPIFIVHKLFKVITHYADKYIDV